MFDSTEAVNLAKEAKEIVLALAGKSSTFRQGMLPDSTVKLMCDVLEDLDYDSQQIAAGYVIIELYKRKVALQEKTK